jgi:hypothetical protein
MIAIQTPKERSLMRGITQYSLLAKPLANTEKSFSLESIEEYLSLRILKFLLRFP